MKLKKRESLGKKIAIGMSLINLANVVGPFGMLTTDISVPGGHVYADNDMHGTSVNLPGEMGGYVQTMFSPRVAYADSKSIEKLPNSGGTSVVVSNGETSTIGTMSKGGLQQVNAGGSGTINEMNGGVQTVAGVSDGVKAGEGIVTVMNDGVQSGYGTVSVGTMHSGSQEVRENGSGTVGEMNGGKQILRSYATGTITTMNAGVQDVSVHGGIGGTIVTMYDGKQVVSKGSGTVSTMSNGEQTVFSGGSGTIEEMNGGEQRLGDVDYGRVFAGGNGTVVTMNGGAQTVYDGGNGTVGEMNKGQQVVSSGGSGTVGIMNGGEDSQQYVHDGTGTITTMNGGTQFVYSGGNGEVTTMSGGTQYVNSGGNGEVTTMNSGGTQYVSSGATGTVGTMSGGSQDVSSGATGTVGTMSAGKQTVYKGGNGYVTDMSSGSQTVSSGGTGTVATMSGGEQTVRGLGYVTTMEGGMQYVSVNGFGRVLTMSGGGQTVYTGAYGRVSAMIGGVQAVSSGGDGLVSAMNGGKQTVYADGTGTVEEMNGGVQDVLSGTVIHTTSGDTYTAQIITMNKGTQNVKDGVGYVSTMVSGTQYVSSGGSGKVEAMNGGNQTVEKDGTGTIGTMEGGQQNVYGSGTVSTMNSGKQMVYSGGSGTVTEMNGGAQQIFSGSGTVGTMNGGMQVVYDNQVGTIGTLYSGGTQHVSEKGTSIVSSLQGGLIIEDKGAKVTVKSVTGGTWQLNSGVTKDDQKVNGYTLNVLDGATVKTLTVENGVANVAVLDSGGTQTVFSGGTVTVTTMNGGEQHVSAGGTGTITTMNGGTQIVSNGGSGMIDKMAGGKQTLQEGAAGSIKEVTSTGKVDVELKGNNSFKFPETGGLCLNSLENSDNPTAPSTIEVYGKGHTISTDLAVPGNKLNFYIPNTAEKNNVMINVKGKADITGATVKAGVQDGTKLKNQDTIILINAGTLVADGITTGKLEDAGFAAWDLDIAANDKQLTAVVKNLEPDMEKAKIFAETRAGGAALLNTAVNLMIGEGMEGAMAAADEADSQAAAGQNAGGASSGGFTPYAAIGGNSMRYETGSYVDSDGWGINVGFSRKLHYENHTLTLAPLVEYGKANYASHLDDGTRGDGSNQFLGIGCIVRDEQNDGMYYEGSLRVGRMKGDYRGEANSSYDTASNYLGFHAGIGKVFKYQDNKLDIYGKFFWSRQGGDDVVITSDSGAANYTFDAINSYRMRIGTRWTQQIATRQAVYMGAAWDYEFDSEARAVYHAAGGDFGTPSPSMKGSSGMFELGWKYQAAKKDPLSVDLGLTGWFGKQRGLQFTGGFAWEF